MVTGSTLTVLGGVSRPSCSNVLLIPIIGLVAHGCWLSLLLLSLAEKQVADWRGEAV